MNIEKLKVRLRQTPVLLLAAALLALTVYTSASSLVKVARSFTDGNSGMTVPEVKGESVEKNETESESGSVNSVNEDIEDSEETQSNDDIPNAPIAGNLGFIPTPTTSIVLPAAVANPTSVPTGISANRCIITVFGNKYDVTPLQTTHPGGNVFVCGSDNSAAYQSAHGTNVSKLTPYLVTTNGSSAGQTGTTTSVTPSPSGNFSFDESENEQELEAQKKMFEQALEDAKQELEDNHEYEDD